MTSMFKFAAIAMVGALSAVGAAKAVVSLDDLRQPDLRG
ncbi:MAG TPA: TIGR02281 family clan AA aspartic protease, partial [Caulobacter sp.]|nr:TIGR02281 family clan AA aspartic protease [Caulobacter sp.]